MVSFGCLPSLRPCLRIIIGGIPFDVGSNGISCNNCFEEGGDPYIRSIDICFVPMVRIDDFLAAICTVTVCHASDERFQVCAFYNLAIFVNRERVFKIDFKKYFIAFGDIILYVYLDGRCRRKIKRVGSLLIVFSIIGIVDVMFASYG